MQRDKDVNCKIKLDAKKGVFSKLVIFVLSLVFALSAAFVFGGCSVCRYCIDDSECEFCAIRNYTTVELFDNFSPSVVEINAGSQKGTGFVVRNLGSSVYIATNHHVIEDFILDNSVGINIQFVNKALAFSDDEVLLVGYDEYFDIAVLKVTSPSSNSLATFEGIRQINQIHANPVIGAQLFALGNMDGVGIAAFSGMVSLTDRILDFGTSTPLSLRFRPTIQVCVNLNQGTSGGPVLDMSGRLVGIAAFQSPKDSDGRPQVGVSFIMPACIVMALVDNAIENPTGTAIERFAVRLESANRISMIGLGGLVLERESDGNFTISSIGTQPTNTTGSWLSTGDTIENISSLRIRNNAVSFTEIISTLLLYIVQTTGDRLTIRTTQDSITFNNLRR